MLQHTTKGLNASWEGQNSWRLEECLILHLEVIFHPAHRNIWAAFCSYLNKSCFMTEHMPKAEFCPVICTYQLMQREADKHFAV